MTKFRSACVVSVAAMMAHALVGAQSVPTPFKLGTFERQGRPFVGIVLRESVVIDFAAAHAAVRTAAVGPSPPPTDMKDLIARYDHGCARANLEIVRSSRGRREQSARAYMYDLVHAEDPAADHVSDDDAQRGGELPRARRRDGAGPPGSPGKRRRRPAGRCRTRRVHRHLGAQGGRSALEPVHVPEGAGGHRRRGRAGSPAAGRTQIEWECELGLVIGRTASRVPIERAADYIFGYTLENDMSDRGGRGDTRYGSDWLVTKNHDTFAPMGPFITPKEFVKDVGNLAITFSLNGKVLQEGSTNQMIHTVTSRSTTRRIC